MSNRIIYELGGLNLNTADIVINSATGILDQPELKERKSQDWNEAHGLIIDRSAPRFKERNIALNFTFVAANSTTMTTTIASISNALRSAGLKMLKITLPDLTDKPLIYYVALNGTIQYNRKYTGGAIVVNGTINLIEPEPQKKIYKATGKVAASLTTSSTAPINVYFDEANIVFDVQGASQTNSHTFTTNGDHYVVITGDIDNLTVNSVTNLTSVWTLL